MVAALLKISQREPCGGLAAEQAKRMATHRVPWIRRRSNSAARIWVIQWRTLATSPRNGLRQDWGYSQMAKDGYDIHVVHTRKENGLVQDNGTQQFHGPHPEGWQPTQGSERSSREQECRRAGVGWVLHRRPCRSDCRTAWTSPKGSLAKVFVLLEEERVGELHLCYFSPAIGPTTMSKNEQLRLDAAAMVVGSSWSWAYLQSGLEHDVPEFMIARRKAAQAQAYALPRSHLMHGTEEVWRQLEVWFLE